MALNIEMIVMFRKVAIIRATDLRERLSTH